MRPALRSGLEAPEHSRHCRHAGEFADQGSFDDAAGNKLAGNRTQGSTTSTSAGAKVTVEFLLTELAHGEDIEMDLSFDGSERGAGHEIMITGGGMILGRPYVTFIHDQTQGHNNTGTGLFDGGYGIAWLDDPGDGGLLSFKSYALGANGISASVRNVITESVPEPSTWATLVMGIVVLGLRARRRSPPRPPRN
jgi:hypothetical protein